MVRVSAWAVAALSLLSVAAYDALPDDAASSPPTKVSVKSQCTEPPVPNGGFESGSIQPWLEYLRPVPGQAESSLKIVKDGYKSNYALQMAVGFTAQIKQAIPTCESTIYTVSFAYKVLNATATCIIRTTANSSTQNVYQSVVSPLLPGNWKMATLKFNSELAEPYELRIALVCQYEDSSATILLDDVQVKPTGSVAAKGCPKLVTLPNGGFDDGQIAPWEPDGGENPPQYAIVSPGYNSPYALEMDFAESNYTISELAYFFNGTCEGYEYNVSFALNWINYTGPASNLDTGCSLGVGINGCAPLVTHENTYVALSTPGWKEHSYVCLADANNEGVIFVGMTCQTGSQTQIPAFAVQVDNFSYELLPTPYPIPPTSTASPGAPTATSQGRAEPRWV